MAIEIMANEHLVVMLQLFKIS